jgi:hypothetical protein
VSRYVHFLDSSALVKLYVREPGTEQMLELAAKPDTRFAALSITRVECRAALRRRQRARDIDEATTSAVLVRIEEDLRALFAVQPVDDNVLTGAMQLLDKHSLRAYDSMQLSAALNFQVQGPASTVVFVCSDATLLQAARAEGALCFDPAQDALS